MENNMYVISMPYPNHIKLPDILEEDDGQVMYFETEKEAKSFLQRLYDDRGYDIQALVDDNVQVMRVQ